MCVFSYNKIMDISEKVRSALRRSIHQSGMKQAVLAHKAGISSSGLRDFLSGRATTIGVANLEKLALALGQEVTDLLMDAGVPSTVVPVRVYDISVSAGFGAWPEDKNEPSREIVLFDRRWLRSLSEVRQTDLSIVYIRGDSMEPTLREGDQALVDLSKKHAPRDGIYVFQSDGWLLVKRLMLNIHSGLVTISSDNKAYGPPYEVNRTEIQALGQVIWVGRKI
ncbi:MAG: prophage MuMc02 S24 family peptidase [Rhodospirillaceae bacterium]|nr:MAG: prophage MuMc02 S24 family peptidase [Rhodospirillaceae bacterium]